MGFNIINILPPSVEEPNDTPREFINIDKEDFEFERKEVLDQEIVETLPSGEQRTRIQPVAKVHHYKIKAGETKVLPKYLVNFAARKLARKMFKRDAMEEWEKLPVDKRIGFPRLRNEEEEKKLMEEMVASNKKVKEPIKAPNLPPEEDSGTKQPVGLPPKETGYKCEICGFEAKSRIGLEGHKRGHKVRGEK